MGPSRYHVDEPEEWHGSHRLAADGRLVRSRGAAAEEPDTPGAARRVRLASAEKLVVENVNGTLGRW
jgi:hypothetical protein